jgi:pimeloyl-ACP methyl ester carboxylesterase
MIKLYQIRRFSVDCATNQRAIIKRKHAIHASGFDMEVRCKLVFFAPKGVAIPIAASVFPDELYAAPRSWSEKAYPKLIHYNRLPKGCHFAAWEQPELFVGEMRAGFKSLR